MKHIAVGKYLVVQIKKKPEAGTQKGLLITNITKPWEHVNHALVLSVGALAQIDIKEGDMVIMRGNSGVPIAPAEDDLTIRVVEETEILVKIV